MPQVRHLAAIALPLLAVCATAATVNAEPTPIIVTIDQETTYQTMEGFGYSSAWWAHHVGGWPEGPRERILDLLYTDAGADLSVFRYNPGAGVDPAVEDPWRTKVSYETAPGDYDWSVDPNGLRIMQGALDRGVEEVVFCYYSPPARLTVNGRPSGGDEGLSNMHPDSFDEFATYCVDIAEHWRQALGLDHITVSPINEPQWPWGKDNRSQEGLFLTPVETAGALRAVADEIAERQVPLLLEGPEAGEWSRSTLDYIREIAKDPVLPDALHRLAIHSYWSEPEHRTELHDLLDAVGIDKPISMTEWCHMEWVRDLGMDTALLLADTIYHDLTLGDVVSWSGWMGVGPYDFKTGLVHVDRDTYEIIEPKRLWVMSQFSRYIRPGAVRIGCEADTDDSLQALAFRSNDTGDLVCVLTNQGDESVRVRLVGSAIALSATSTDASRDVEAVAVEDNGLFLAGTSVTTVLLRADRSR